MVHVSVRLESARCLDLVVDITEAKESFKMGADLGNWIAEFNYGLMLSHDSTSESEERYASTYYRHLAFQDVW
jgi:hypothetical protein